MKIFFVSLNRELTIDKCLSEDSLSGDLSFSLKTIFK